MTYSLIPNAIIPNRWYKDTVFRDLFGTHENRAYALSLYNALAGTDYTDADELEHVVLGTAIFMRMNNDVSFLIHHELVLIEHQSTVNPNMPLRGLIYAARYYETYLASLGRKVYSTTRVPIPAPRFFVLYNGQKKQPARKEMLLSDAYGGMEGDIEVKATVINVNAGKNPGLEDACEALRGYSFIVARSRELCETMGAGEALACAVDECIQRGDLVEYLKDKKEEVVSMFMEEWDEEAFREQLREDAIAEGLEEGRARGLEEGRARGLEEGLRDGRAEGLRDGRAEGLRDGRAEGLRDGRARGLEEGLRDGRAEGRVAALAEAVGNVMASLGLDAERAMEAVGVAASERAAVLGRL